jgi:NAD(P)-dependent dehydrogenase (short-subunit alcohol dehydrogenase family)
MVDIDEEGLHQVETSISSHGGKVSSRVCDLTQEEQVRELVHDIAHQYHKIDILSHVAGVYPAKPLLETTTEDYRKIFHVNMDSCFFLTQSVLPYMQKAGYGRIVNTTSQTIVKPEPGLSVYTASKGAVAAFTRATAVEAGPGITANVISPTMIATERTAAAPEMQPWLTKVVDLQVVKRNGTPEDVAHAFIYLASPEAGFITGQVFNVGGGAVFL